MQYSDNAHHKTSHSVKHVDAKAGKNLKTMKKMEVRKLQRAERAEKWKQLLESKPDDKYQDPKDVAAIRNAINNMGDFKLKTAADYIVPESERVDADKKKRQIALLNSNINNLQEEFNHKVFLLRDRKVELVKEFTKRNEELIELKRRLDGLNESCDAHLVVPILEPFMFSENRDLVTDEDVKQFQSLETEKNKVSAKKGDEMGFGGGGTFLAIDNSNPVTEDEVIKMAGPDGGMNLADLSVEELARRAANNAVDFEKPKSKRLKIHDRTKEVEKIKYKYEINQIKKVCNFLIK